MSEFKIDLDASPATEQELREILTALRKVKMDHGWGKVLIVVKNGAIEDIETTTSKRLALMDKK